MEEFRNTLMRQLEDLAALSERNGLIDVKPFKDWKGSKYWSNAIFKMRLCNAGEVLEISNYAEQFSGDSKDRAIKIETVARSIYEINGIPIGSPDEVLKYNQKHNTNLTRVEYLRNWVKDLETIVVDTLYSVYVALQLKQIRLVMGESQCATCGNVYENTNLPDNSKKIKYSTSEIICGKCIEEGIDTKDFDIEVFKCEKCKKEFEKFEEFSKHNDTCTTTDFDTI